jgi:hypothetical protein
MSIVKINIDERYSEFRHRRLEVEHLVGQRHPAEQR